MLHLQSTPDRIEPASGRPAVEDNARVFQILPLITDARSPGEVISLFREAVMGLGADAGYFLSCLRDDATRTSFRSFWACDPAWPAEYASQRWFEHDPWLRYASCDAEPIRASYLTCSSPEENAFIRAAAEHGFASALIAPAPSSVGLSRVAASALAVARSALRHAGSDSIREEQASHRRVPCGRCTASLLKFSLVRNGGAYRWLDPAWFDRCLLF